MMRSESLTYESGLDANKHLWLFDFSFRIPKNGAGTRLIFAPVKALSRRSQRQDANSLRGCTLAIEVLHDDSTVLLRSSDLCVH